MSKKAFFKALVLALALAGTLFITDGTAARVAADGCERTYTVRPGDTLIAIAERFDTSVETLMQLNPIQDPSWIYVGQVLCLPDPGAAPGGCGETYTVRTGDTLIAIARAFDTSVQTLMQLNQIDNPNYIYAGQVLCVSALALTPGQVVIEVVYSRASFSVEDGPTLESLAVTRIEFPLAEVQDHIKTEESPDQLRTSVPDDAPVRLWISRPEKAPKYVLVVVDDDQPFTDLALKTPEKRVVIEKLEILEEEQELQQVQEITVWLEADSGERYPLPIGAASYVETVEDAKSSQSRVFLVLLSDGQGAYKVSFALSEEIFGPPGAGSWARCERWKRMPGWYYRWLRAWYGCPWR
jgi:LysM repeat protein